MASPGFFAQLGTAPLFSCLLVLPFTGIWHADVEMSTDIPLTPGPQVLVFSGTTYACTVVRAADDAGVRSVRLVGGTGGWRTVVPPKPYGPSPAGVPTSLVLADTAATVGEIPPVVDPTVAPTLGSYWTRQGGLASLTLQRVLGDAWWMDPLGVVQTAPRLPVPVVTPFYATRLNGKAGIYEIATDFPADWTPGKVFVGPVVSGTVSRVMHHARGGMFRTEVMVP